MLLGVWYVDEKLGGMSVYVAMEILNFFEGRREREEIEELLRNVVGLDVIVVMGVEVYGYGY